MEKIKSFEEACKALGIEPNVPDFSNSPVEHQKALSAHYKLVIIAQALNEGWKANFDDHNEWKYYPWFVKQPGVGFSDLVCGRSDANAHVGSRLCYKSRELARYAGETFKELYNEYYLYS